VESTCVRRGFFRRGSVAVGSIFVRRGATAIDRRNGANNRFNESILAILEKPCLSGGFIEGQPRIRFLFGSNAKLEKRQF
jgi:hypothetical protein